MKKTVYRRYAPSGQILEEMITEEEGEDNIKVFRVDAEAGEIIEETPCVDDVFPVAGFSAGPDNGEEG